MRFLSTVLIVLGGVMVLWPLLVLGWLWIESLRPRAYHDTYYVVFFGWQTAAYIFLTIALLVSGFWLRARN